MSTSKVFHDSVHGTVKLHEVLVAIIDTPEYQRLRDIKQLGTAYWVFPGACHNRFEHGIGTSHLSGLLIEALREFNQIEDLEISDTEVLCVKIAALCHDMGHGPFSHFFDKTFMKRLHPEVNWKHEDASCMMFQHMLKNNPSVKRIFDNNNISGEECLLIERIIKGRKPLVDNIEESIVRNNKKLKKWFLYEIVSNSRTGVDCDKIDYLARDAHHVGVKNTFDFQRFAQNVCVKCIDEQLQICVRDKEVYNLYELFHLRWRLHRQVYQHKTTNVTDELVFQIFKSVNMKYKFSNTIKDMSQFTHLTDSIIYEILRSPSTDYSIKRAKLFLNRLQSRHFYKMCGEVIVPSEMKNFMTSGDEMSKERIASAIADTTNGLQSNDMYVVVANLDFGMKDKNPIENITFFSKNNVTFKYQAHQLSHTLPSKYQEWYIRVFAKENKNLDLLTQAFQEWCNKKRLPLPNSVQKDA